MKFRFWFIRIFFVFVFFGLVGNMYVVQVERGAVYAEKAEAQQEAAGNLDPSRGILFFTDKNQNDIPAVLNKEYPTVYAVPIEITDPASAAERMSKIFDISAEKLKESFSKPKDQYELMAEKATADQVSAVKDADIPGIYVRNKVFRFYSFKSMGAHILGYISSGSDGIVAGRYGLELLFDNQLRGVRGISQHDRIIQPANGADIRLTIDRNIQAEGEKIIAGLMEEWGAEGASVLVQEPQTGKILALANLPTFDPNEYGKYPIASFLNTSIQSVYEPGSVFKIITMSAGIDAGKITPDTTYYDSGSVTLNGRTIQNWDHEAHGTQTIRQVIEKSLNTGSIFAERKTGHNVFSTYVKKFGFGEKTGIQLPGEVSGSLKNLEKGQDVEYATASFGQGISVTPIEMISAVSAIANGGVLMRPLILADEKTEVIRRVIQKETANTVTDMMVSAVNVNILAHIPEYNVAGKTGTAFIPDFTRGGYTDDVINTYVGFAPASDPKFTILIKLVRPKNAPLAGQTVVPAFKKLAEYLLNYYQVAPDHSSTTL